MREYIDRAELYEAMNSQDCEFSLIDALALIEKFPAADAVEARHGYWIDLNAENSTGPLFKCSECSHLHNLNRNDLDLERVELNPLYCDACGARMNKEKQDELL